MPFEAGQRQDRYALDTGSDTVEIGAVSIGNPHAVLEVAAVDLAPVATLGPAIESHRRFPRRVNVGIHGNRRSRADPAAGLRARRR